MRISVKELGQIHYNHGYLQEANQQWMKSNDMSVEDDDVLQLSYLIAKSAFQSGQDFLLSKFS